MDKPIRKAVRCYLIKDNMVVATKYKQGNKDGYYDIPGGKIEEGEFSEQTAIREMKEETGLDVKELKYKGNMILNIQIEYLILMYFLQLRVKENHKNLKRIHQSGLRYKNYYKKKKYYLIL